MVKKIQIINPIALEKSVSSVLNVIVGMRLISIINQETSALVVEYIFKAGDNKSPFIYFVFALIHFYLIS